MTNTTTDRAEAVRSLRSLAAAYRTLEQAEDDKLAAARVKLIATLNAEQVALLDAATIAAWDSGRLFARGVDAEAEAKAVAAGERD